MSGRLPEAFLDRVREQLGPEFSAFQEAMDQPPLRGLRMNPLRKGGDHPFRDAGAPIPWREGAWEIPADSRAGGTLAHEAGAFYLQEPSAMIPAAVLAAKPGERILDLCGAPGGKSTQMGADLAGEGLLIANEPIPKRAAVLSQNIERMGIPNAIVTCAWPEQLAGKWPEGFDGVMVDAPCSGEGMFRREPESREEWSPEKAQGCAERQREILRAAAKLVRPGGRLVYATCTYHPAENEEQIAWFLKNDSDYTLEPFQLPGVDGAKGMFTCWPHRTRGEGQFVALLRKKGVESGKGRSGENSFPLSREAESLWRGAGLLLPRPNAQFGQTLARIPENREIPDFAGIRVLRLGLHVAEIRGRNLMPDHACAMAECFGGYAPRKLRGEEALGFFRGETLSEAGSGWMPVTWQGMPLGWGKASGGILKNHLPKGLRKNRLIL